METSSGKTKSVFVRAALTLLAVVMTSATAWAANVVGSLDCCYEVTHGIYVKGWAYDPDMSSASVSMQVKVYTDAGCTSMYGAAHSFTANVSRPDVNDAKGITGDHGFSETIAIADEGTYWVKIYAYDRASPNNSDSPVVQVGSTRQVTVTSQTIINLTPETGAVTLEDGDVLKGTGGINTHVSIADGATVTLCGVDITAIPHDIYQINYLWAGLTCAGDAIIVLADGTTNKVKGGYYEYPGILIPVVKTLTIRGSGALEAYSGIRYDNANGKRYAKSCGIGGRYQYPCGNIVIEGGNITAVGKGDTDGGPGIGTYDEGGGSGDITITGGNVTAIGGKNAAGIGSGHMSRCGNITITGGNVTAIGGAWAAGIGTGEGTTKSHSSCGTITITSGVTSVTATHGTIADGYECYAIGKGYNSDKITINISSNLIDMTEGDTRTLWGLALNDGTSNTDAIGQKNAMTTDVQLRDRTLFKDGAWNTLCLPFEVSTTDSPLAGDGVEAMMLNTTESKLEGGTLTLNFDAATVIPAGTPFIIRWNNTGATIENPVFEGVTVNATAPTPVTSNDNKVSFVGSYSPVALTPNDMSNLFLGEANTLYYPNDANNADGNYYVNAFRAFFSLDPTATVKEFKLNFEDSEDATSIDSLTPALSKGEGDIYNLAGQRLSKMQHGIYIVNGKKVLK